MNIQSLVIVAGVLLSGAHLQEDFFDRLTGDVVVFTEEGLVRGERVQAFVSDFTKTYGVSNYKQVFTKEANPKLVYEIGEISTGNGTFSVMFLKQTGAGAKDIELLVIYQKTGDGPAAEIDRARTEWMKLCNAHQAAVLVKQKYTSNAFYYNRGRLLQGTESITQEYSYMNAPTYSLTLTPLHVAFVTPSIVYEIGQCSGSYPGPYVLLWEKQDDGSWQVLMDTNY